MAKTAECILETTGYKATFCLKGFDDKWVDVTIRFDLHPELGAVSLESVPEMVEIRDFHRLIKYFEQHIDGLRHPPLDDSPVFVTHGLGFQIQALVGEVFTENGEEFIKFGLLFLVYIGRREGWSRVYLGGQSVILGEQIEAFKRSLYAALDHLENAP